MERTEDELPKTINVGALDGDTFSITLESGHTIFLELRTEFKNRLSPPSFRVEISASPTPMGRTSAGPEGCPLP